MKRNISSNAVALLLISLMLLGSLAFLSSNVAYGQENITFTSGVKMGFTSTNTMTFQPETMSFKFGTGIRMQFQEVIPDGLLMVCDYILVSWPPGYMPPMCSWWEVFDPLTGKPFGEIHIDGPGGPGEFHVDMVSPGPIPIPIGWPIWAEMKLPKVEPCVIYVVHEPTHWWPSPCTWWMFIDPETGQRFDFHVDWTNESCEFHIDRIYPGPFIPLFPLYELKAYSVGQIDEIHNCNWFEVLDPPGFAPTPCSWWEILDLTGAPTGFEFHVDNVVDGKFHVDIVRPDPIIIPWGPTGTITVREKIDGIAKCDWFKASDPSLTPETCSWWRIISPDIGDVEFHVDQANPDGTFHVDLVEPTTILPTYEVTAERKIDDIVPCDSFKVIDPPGFLPKHCSWWRIISPQQWAGIIFHVDSNDEISRFHVDEVQGQLPPIEIPPWQVTAEPYQPPQPPPPEILDVELYPREVVDLGDPTSTQWHELHPSKTNYYHLMSWEPGRVLSPEDQIDMYLVDPLVQIYVETAFVDPLFPFGSEWHETYPTFCQWWQFTSWEDNGDGYLSPSDQIDMVNMATGDVVWFHVQEVIPPDPAPGPKQMVLDVKYWFQVDEVTVDMKLSPLDPGIPIFVEYKCGYWTFDPKKPICTKWNQIDPEMGPVRCLHLTSWIDNGNGVLDYWDIIDMTPLYPTPGPVEYYHVDFMSISLKLTPKPSPPVVPPPPKGPMYLDSLSSYDMFDLSKPVSTYWHEIYPYYSRMWHLSSWENFWGLSPSDQIVLALKDELREPIPGTEAEYHVDKLTVAMNLTSMEDLREHIVKFEESLKEFKMYHWRYPVSTQWLEVNPEYSRQWHIMEWYDENPDGLLGYCDYILMIDKHTGWMEWFHVESLSTDMWLTISHDIAVTNVTPLKTAVGQGYPMNINVTVENQGAYTENFNVTVYANTTIVDTLSANITLTSGDSTTITFTWNTVGFARGNYTIKAVADTVPGETHIADNTLLDGWVKVVIPGNVNGDGIVDMKDITIALRNYGKTC